MPDDHDRAARGPEGPDIDLADSPGRIGYASPVGIYERCLCPQLTEWALDNGWVHRHRRELLAPLRGRVLEIGFGTGLNLRHYPLTIAELDILDPAEGMHAKARRRIRASKIPVRTYAQSAETLPFDDESFDGAVCTFTLCTIPDPVSAVREVRRVLAEGATFRIFEHVASQLPSVRAWQDRLNPVQNVLGCGCNLNRDVEAILTEAGFIDRSLTRVTEPRMPALFREHLWGWVTKTS